jgi:hypothetical protein
MYDLVRSVLREVPVRRILTGMPAAKALNFNAMASPKAID